MLKSASVFLFCTSKKGIIYMGGREWYRMCSRQPTVGLALLKIKQFILSEQTATFKVD
jgi:hypothetical protein